MLWQLIRQPKECENWIKEIIARRQNNVFAEEDGTITMFDLLLETKPGKDYNVPEMEQLIDEAFLFLAAGVDTTACTLAHATYYILSDDDILAKLRAELKGVPRDVNGNFEWRHLANLPYLVRRPPII
jgi:cytochrome P450